METVNLDHLADVAATIESLFSGAKEQAGAVAEEAQFHAEEIVNGANQQAKKAMDDAKQHAAKITFGAENKANSIMGEASNQANVIISKAKDQADLIIEGTRQKAEKSLEKTKQQAETILENANKEASQIIEKANTVTANMIEEAKTQGVAIKEQAHQEGLAEGRQDALNVVRQELTENLTKALAMINEIESERMQRISSSEPELLKLAVTIAEKIIGEELKTDALCQLQIVREALTRTTTANKIIIRIHSDDLQIVHDNLTLLQSSFSEPKPIEVKEDCSITRGSCFVETDHGNLDVRIKSQLEQIMNELFKAGRLE
jgi:flagellar assembly protein FliH